MGIIPSLKYRRFDGGGFRRLHEDLKKCPSIEKECDPELVRYIWTIPAYVGPAIKDVQEFQDIDKEGATDLYLAIKKEIYRILGRPWDDRP